MEDIRLPQHVVRRFQRRWAARFRQMPEAWQRPERAPSSPSHGGDDPLRSSQVRRLLQGSLRPPAVDRTLVFSHAEA
jgi:hypothetical protein